MTGLNEQGYPPRGADDVGREERNRNVAQEVRDWVDISKGWFWKKHMDDELQLPPGNDRKASLAEIGRLLKSKKLAHHKVDNGRYRKRHANMEEIEWWTATGKDLPIRWPLGLENVCKFFPGNIAIITALPNEGKSGWVLDFLRKCVEDIDVLKEWFKPINDDTDRIVQVLDSEKAKEELYDRIIKMEDMDQQVIRDNVGFYEKNSDQADAIAPDSINIVDFLEVHENYSEIGGTIQEIHNNLDGGIAIVAIQKKGRESDFALGAYRSLEKPKVYVSLKRDYEGNENIMKLVKAKAWRTDRDPNGMVCKYKLVQGNKFIITRPLEHEYYGEKNSKW